MSADQNPECHNDYRTSRYLPDGPEHLQDAVIAAIVSFVDMLFETELPKEDEARAECAASNSLQRRGGVETFFC